MCVTFHSTEPRGQHGWSRSWRGVGQSERAGRRLAHRMGQRNEDYCKESKAVAECRAEALIESTSQIIVLVANIAELQFAAEVPKGC